MSGKLWVRQIRKNKMVADAVAPCERNTWQEALRECCHKLDIGVPMVLSRHLKDWEDFSQTRFLPEHFLEAVRFDRLEAEYFDPDEKAAKKRRPQEEE